MLAEGPKKLNILRAFIHEFRHGQLGDAAALKTLLFNNASSNNPTLHTQVRPLLKRNAIPISIPELLSLPPATFGHAYGIFLQQHKLKPFNFSGRYDDWFVDHDPTMIRYIRIHDMVHVILGFDTTLEGELGVYSFIAEQNYSSTLNKAYRTAAFIYPLIKPSRRRSLKAADERGKNLAANAKNLITEPLEDYFEENLNTLKARLLGP